MSEDIIKSGEILLYNYEDKKEFLNVYFKDETFWLSQKAMAELFECTPDNISLLLKNIYKEEELSLEATTEEFSVVRKEGDRNVKRTLDFYNLRRNVLQGKGNVSHSDAIAKVSEIYSEFRKKQDKEYISEFDKETAKYLKGE